MLCLFIIHFLYWGKNMILSVDVMGFENPISDAIQACRDFVKHNKDVKIILVGDQNQIKNCLLESDNFDIEHADDVINMSDDPLSVRNRKNSSMYKAIELVKLNKANGVLSAGSTPCYVFLTFIILGKMKHVTKPCFMPFLPTRDGKGLSILDVGANKECNSDDLVCFAKMGGLYLKEVRKIRNPRIGILNIGTEENKGFDYHIEANKKLKKLNVINYKGFIESRDLLEGGKIDLLVCDGYSGNLVLKALEGCFKTSINSFFDFYKKPYGWLGFIFSLPILLKLKKKYDYKNNAGAIVIGLNKIAIKTHGSADYKQFYSSLRLLKETINSNLIQLLNREFNDA